VAGLRPRPTHGRIDDRADALGGQRAQLAAAAFVIVRPRRPIRPGGSSAARQRLSTKDVLMHVGRPESADPPPGPPNGWKTWLIRPANSLLNDSLSLNLAVNEITVPQGGPGMARGSLVAVQLPVDGEFSPDQHQAFLDGPGRGRLPRRSVARPSSANVTAPGRRAHRVAPGPGTAGRRPAGRTRSPADPALCSARRRFRGFAAIPEGGGAGQQRGRLRPRPMGRNTSWRWRAGPWPGGCRSATPIWPRAEFKDVGTRAHPWTGAVVARSSASAA